MGAVAARSPGALESGMRRIVIAMAAALSAEAKIELHGALASELHVTPTAAHFRVHELGLLAELVKAHGRSFGTVRTVPRKLYDEQRSADALPSRVLVDRYDGWTNACQAADGLLQDGRFFGPSLPWSVRAPQPVVAPFTCEEAIKAVRQCAKECFRNKHHPPSTWMYGEWVRRKRLAARMAGKTVRLPYLTRVYELLAPDSVPGKSKWQVVIDASLAQRHKF